MTGAEQLVSKYQTGSLFDQPDNGISSVLPGRDAFHEYQICADETCVTILPPSPTPQPRGAGLKYDSGKLRYDLVPPHAIKAIADVLTYGADKYAPNSWQTVSDGETRYIAAMMRHFEAYREGEELDPETGKSHLSHCLCNLTFLLWFQQNRLRDS